MLQTKIHVYRGITQSSQRTLASFITCQEMQRSLTRLSKGFKIQASMRELLTHWYFSAWRSHNVKTSVVTITNPYSLMLYNIPWSPYVIDDYNSTTAWLNLRCFCLIVQRSSDHTTIQPNMGQAGQQWSPPSFAAGCQLLENKSVRLNDR